MPLIEVKDLRGSIWKENPHLEYVSPFKEFKEELGAKEAGKIIKAAYMVFDPKSSLRDSLSEDEANEDIVKNYLKNEEWDWEPYMHIVEAILDKNLTDAEKRLRKLKSEMDGLDRLLDSWAWSKDNASKKISIIEKSKTLWEDYFDLESKVQQEKSNTLSYGNYEKSLIEKYAAKEG